MKPCRNVELVTLALLLAHSGITSADEPDKRCRKLFDDGMELRKGWHQAPDNVREMLVDKTLAALNEASSVCGEASRSAHDSRQAAELASLGILAKGEALEATGKQDEARSTYREGRREIEDLEGHVSPSLILILEKLSQLELLYSQYEAGRKLYEEALEIRREAFGSTDPRVIDGLLLLASTYVPQTFPADPAERDKIGWSADTAEDYYKEALSLSLASDGQRLEEVVTLYVALLETVGNRSPDIEELKALGEGR